MPSLGRNIQLKLFQSQELAPLRDTDTSLVSRGAGTYTRSMNMEGNSFISSLYLHAIDPGATVKVNYWDTTTGDGNGERYDLTSHVIVGPADVGNTSRINVSQIHNKPNIEIIVAGGSATFGVYATVVSSFVGDSNVSVQNALVKTAYDAIAASYPNTTTEVYSYKIGGLAGSTVATVTVIYSDATKLQVTSVEVT